jgi:hypothetical protein
MMPLILPKDKPIIKKGRSYKTNDIVAFQKRDNLITHRIIYISPSNEHLITKGDNNLKSDGKNKPRQILGKVENIKRDNKTLTLSHIYLSQSSAYLKELEKIAGEFSQNKIPYIILKGLPLHLHFGKKPPQRLYLDTDILIKKTYFSKADKTLSRLGFKKQKHVLFGKKIKYPTQISYIKTTKPFPVVIDLHLEPSIGFTKIKNLNSLLPSTRAYTQHLFENIQLVKVNENKFPILTTKALLVYLLLHLYHHNFQGAHRMEFINNLVRNQKIDWGQIERTMRKFKFENFIFPGILILERYYEISIPKKQLSAATPSFGPRLTSYIVTKFVNPFNTGSRACEGAKRFILLLLLSPSSASQKIKVLLEKETRNYFLSTIKSFFFRTSRNSSKSRSA